MHPVLEEPTKRINMDTYVRHLDWIDNVRKDTLEPRAYIYRRALEAGLKALYPDREPGAESA